jgi:hypothetical protein
MPHWFRIRKQFLLELLRVDEDLALVATSTHTSVITSDIFPVFVLRVDVLHRTSPTVALVTQTHIDPKVFFILAS